MRIKNKKTKAVYPMKKADWDQMPKSYKDAYEVVSDEEGDEQEVKALPVTGGKKDGTKSSKKADKPSSGEKKDGKK